SFSYGSPLCRSDSQNVSFDEPLWGSGDAGLGPFDDRTIRSGRCPLAVFDVSPFTLARFCFLCSKLLKKLFGYFFAVQYRPPKAWEGERNKGTRRSAGLRNFARARQGGVWGYEHRQENCDPRTRQRVW